MARSNCPLFYLCDLGKPPCVEQHTCSALSDIKLSLTKKIRRILSSAYLASRQCVSGGGRERCSCFYIGQRGCCLASGAADAYSAFEESVSGISVRGQEFPQRPADVLPAA